MPRRRTAPPTRTVVCFVRHGTTPTTGKVLPGRAKGLHLNESGIAEATRTGVRLGALNSVRALYSSPLERARETAAAVAKSLHLPVKIDRGLLECDFGEWTGKDLAELRKLPAWKTVIEHPSGFRFPEGESFSEMRLRLLNTIERLVAAHEGEVIAVVSHADPIKVAVTDAIGSPLDLLQRTVISPASVSVVAYSAGPPLVLAVNSTGELGGLGIGAAPDKRAKK